MLLNNYRIILQYNDVIVYAYRYAIPKKSHVKDMIEYLKTEFPHACNLKVERISSKKVDLTVIDFADDERVKSLKLQYVKHQLEKG